MPLYIPAIQVHNSNNINNYVQSSSMFNNSNNQKSFGGNKNVQFTQKNPAMFSYNRQYSRSISSYRYTNN